MREKNSNIELLRITSMFMIVMIHIMTKTSVLWEMNHNQPVYYICWFIYGICMTSVNCYVLISGYFYKETGFKFKKILSIYFQVLFYSVIIGLIMYSLKVEMKSSKLGIIFPIINREYWFATTYLGLCCLIPYLNMIIHRAEEKQLRNLLIIFTILFSVIPTFFHANDWLGDGGAYGIVWFVFLYIAGGYVRKYYREKNKKKFGILYFVCILIVPISKYIVLLSGKAIKGFHIDINLDIIIKISEILFNFNSLPVLCASVFLFVFFCSIEIKNAKAKKYINFFGNLTFGVYLIHNNRNLSGYLWKSLKINYWLVERKNFFIILLIAIIVFIVCSLIECIRQYLFKLFKINILINKIAEKLEELLQKIAKKLL